MPYLHSHFRIVQFVLQIGGQPLAHRATDGTVNRVLDLARRRRNGQIRFHHHRVHFQFQLKVGRNVCAACFLRCENELVNELR